MEGLGWEPILKRVGIRDLCRASGIRPARCMDRSHSCPQSHVSGVFLVVKPGKKILYPKRRI